ncbi:hypothetical protein A9Q84_03370 [Halobacteriovorax marinus]|uniref:Secreted protein n=1 Tax=Halobacteriovorax marinus TaxID=97084 RepID=A0A1Y5FFP1_9BACT|nr:hypothetical protein A9Q84_03370 [Halobacteriovorax marinus]
MKTLLILVATLLVSATASAHMPTESDSWKTIRKHYSKVIVDEPSVKLDGGPMTSAFFVCKSGDVLRTLKKLTKCVKWDNRRGGNRDNDRRVCVEEVKYFGTAVIEGQRERCVSWRTIRRGDDRERICTGYESYDYTLALSHNVDVFRMERGGRDNDNRRGRKLFTKTLSIEDCE